VLVMLDEAGHSHGSIESYRFNSLNIALLKKKFEHTISMIAITCAFALEMLRQFYRILK
jgi:hypothetical protein